MMMIAGVDTNVCVQKVIPGIRLSSKHPTIPPTRMDVERRTCRTASSASTPVCTTPLCAAIQRVSTSGKNRLNPMMYRFLELFRSTYWRADRPGDKFM
jgi:hypothetical protein